jgi:hypothetical protein
MNLKVAEKEKSTQTFAHSRKEKVLDGERWASGG